MRFFNQPHAFYAGIDLHARSMFTHILDSAGATVFERDLPANSNSVANAPGEKHAIRIPPLSFWERGRG